MNQELDIKKHKNSDIPKGSVMAVIGPRGSGKSVVVKALCHKFKVIPQFIVVSKTEKNNKFFEKFIPKKNIHFQWDDRLLARIFNIQDNLIEKYGKEDPRTHMVLILDDCLCDKKIWKQPELLELMMNGRHKNITFMFTLQYPIGISPEIRSNLDFVFVFSQESSSDKKKIFEQYIGVFDNYKQFQFVFDEITQDYQCIVINRKIKSKHASDKIFWYKAPANIPPFKAGHKMFWEEDDDEDDKDSKVCKDGTVLRLLK